MTIPREQMHIRVAILGKVANDFTGFRFGNYDDDDARNMEDAARR